MPDAPDNAICEAVGLTKIFEDFWGRPKAVAVDGIDFDIRPGEVFGFLGPNGSGKSTTVKLLLGLLRPTGGQIRVFGHSPDHVQTKRHIGYLPEETYLYRYLTAAETLDFFGALFSLAQSERRVRSRQLLEMVGLAHSAHRPVGEFSKGMARRIGLAQALINDPDLVVLDEPTSGLDPIGIREVKNLIRHLAERGKTVILCSHLLADVEDVCDRIMVMYAGKVRASGPLRQLLTVDDKTRIVVPQLAPEILERVMGLLNEAVGAAQVTVDRPTRDLESFFLDVVRQARAEKGVTAGVQDSGAIAAYLGRPEAGGDAAILEALATGEPPSETPAEPTGQEVSPEPVEVELLEELSHEEPDATAEPAGSEPAAPTDADRREQSRRIRELLGGDGPQGPTDA